MTTEIAILNRQAVVLAADSAVSTSQKVFQSANKIFSLSKYHPVGLMIFSKASFMGIPWETIIKLYREYIGDHEFDKLSEYADSFLNFITTSEEIVANRIKEDITIKDISRAVIENMDIRLRKEIENLINEYGTTDEEKINKHIESIIDDSISNIESHAELPLRKNLSENVFYKKYNEAIKEIHQKSGGFVPNALSLKKLSHIVYEIVTRAVFPFEYTGLVFAGFGKKDIFPRVCTIQVGDIFCEMLQTHSEDDQQRAITSEMTSQVVGFAQQDVIAMFMEGVHPAFLQASYEAYSNTLESLAKLMVNEIKNEGEKRALQEYARKVTFEMQKVLKDNLSLVSQQNYIQPIVQIIGLLPASEVANLAEALVNLTTIQRQMSFKTATVGGPTDVAMITKGDGLVWIKRKHYFDASLNHHFFANYFRRYKNGKTESEENDL